MDIALHTIFSSSHVVNRVLVVFLYFYSKMDEGNIAFLMYIHLLKYNSKIIQSIGEIIKCKIKHSKLLQYSSRVLGSAVLVAIGIFKLLNLFVESCH